MRAVTLFLSSLLGLAAACGARSDTMEDAGDAGATCPPAEVRGVVGTTFDHACALEGRDADGHEARLTCWTSGEAPTTTFERCVWEIDGEQRCACDEPDWVNTCPNGVPLCLGWNLSFDFASDVVFEP